MKTNKAYSGKKIVYRAYYNGQLIWDYGLHGYGNALASLKASIVPYLESQDTAQMYADSIMDGFGIAEVSDFENIMVNLDAVLKNNAIPHSSNAINGVGTEFSTLQAIIAPFTFDIVYAYGDTTIRLEDYGCPNEAITINGVGVTNINVIDLSCPTVEDVIKILLHFDTSVIDVVMPKTQEPELIVTDLSSDCVSNCTPNVLPRHTVIFINNGVELYRTRVVHGKSCPDPVTIGIIGTPTKPMTVQYTYEYSGWSLIDGGEVENEGKKVLLEEHEYEFGYSEYLGAFVYTDSEPEFILDTDAEYTVVWDGIEYVRSTFVFTSFDGSKCIAVGNTLCAGGENNGDKFAIVYDITHNMTQYLSLETSVSHTVKVYKETHGALSSITKDTIVYAAFEESLRYYTVRFFDGDILVDTVSVPYGETAITNYTKPGHKLTSWYPSNENIIDDTDCYGQFEQITFAKATWGEIKEICDAGNAKDYFVIGEKKPVTFTYEDGTSETINFTIVAMDVDTRKDGTKAALTMMADNLVRDSLKVSSYAKSQWPMYKENEVATFIAKIYNALPADLQAVLSTVRRDMLARADTKIFIPDAYNLDGKTYKEDYDVYNIPQKTRYPYFANGASIVRKKLNDASSDDYWVHSIGYRGGSVGSYYYFYHYVDGASIPSTKYERLDQTARGFLPCFCI